MGQAYDSQPGKLCRLVGPGHQQVLLQNTARSVDGTFMANKERHIAHCTKADSAYGAGLERALIVGATSTTHGQRI